LLGAGNRKKQAHAMKTARLSATIVAISICLLLGTATGATAAPAADDPGAGTKTEPAIPGFGSATSPTTTRKIGSTTTPDFIKVNSGERIDCGGGTITYSGKGGFLIEDVHDVVIQNCRFESTLTQIPTHIGGREVHMTESVCGRAMLPRDTFGCGIAVFIRGQSYNIAIIHNAFTRCGEKCIAVWTEGRNRTPDGKVPTPDRVTIAYNDFSRSYFGIAIGVTAAVEDNEMAQNERVTFAFNRCDGVFRRCARFASGAQGDETNNVIRHWTWAGSDCRGRRGFGPSTTGGARVLLRGNVLDADGSCPQAVDNSFYRNEFSPGEGRGMGMVKVDSGYPNLLANGAQEAANQPDAVTFDVPKYHVLPADQVEAFVKANVGPKP
jgi:hypothetical protein